MCLDLIGIFNSGKAAPQLHDDVHKLAGRWLRDVVRLGINVDDIR